MSERTTELLAVGLEEDMVDHFEDMLRGLDALLGLKLLEVKDIDDDVKEMINKREDYRQKKDWAAADKLRNAILAKGVELEDKATGPQWCWAASGDHGV